MDECPGCADLLDDRVLIRARRRIGPALCAALPDSHVGPIMLSTSAHARPLSPVRRGRKQHGALATGRPLRRDLGRVPALRNRSARFASESSSSPWSLCASTDGYNLPGKFIVTRLDGALQLVVELEGDEHVRGEGHFEDSRPHTEGRSDGTVIQRGADLIQAALTNWSLPSDTEYPW